MLFLKLNLKNREIKLKFWFKIFTLTLTFFCHKSIKWPRSYWLSTKKGRNWRWHRKPEFDINNLEGKSRNRAKNIKVWAFAVFFYPKLFQIQSAYKKYRIRVFFPKRSNNNFALSFSILCCHLDSNARSIFFFEFIPPLILSCYSNRCPRKLLQAT